ncbi:MAG: PKD domain-containing protein, partial [Bacteroidetes bacterium]
MGKHQIFTSKPNIMKKFLPAFFCYFFIATQAIAQITLTESDFFSIGIGTVRAHSNTSGVSPGSGGANQLWDFTYLDTLNFDTTTYIHPAEAFDNEAFPDANIVGFNSGTYIYYQQTPSSIWNLGVTADPNELPGFGNIYLEPKSKIMDLPATYETSFEDSTSFETFLDFDGGTYLFKSTQLTSHVIDGYGLIITPAGGFETLRMQSTKLTKDSLWTDPGTGIFTLSTVNEFTDSSFIFFAAESRGPLVTIAYDEFGNVNNTTFWVSNILGPQPPVAQFSWEPQPDGSIQFTDLSLNDPNIWEWDFGDGNASELQNPAHTFAAPGAYQVCLKATNDTGANTSCQTVTIFDAPTAGFIFTDNGNGSIQFQDQSTNNPNTWLWDFGDGNVSNQQSPQHAYDT